MVKAGVWEAGSDQARNFSAIQERRARGLEERARVRVDGLVAWRSA